MRACDEILRRLPRLHRLLERVRQLARPSAHTHESDNRLICCSPPPDRRSSGSLIDGETYILRSGTLHNILGLGSGAAGVLSGASGVGHNNRFC